MPGVRARSLARRLLPTDEVKKNIVHHLEGRSPPPRPTSQPPAPQPSSFAAHPYNSTNAPSSSFPRRPLIDSILKTARQPVSERYSSDNECNTLIEKLIILERRNSMLPRCVVGERGNLAINTACHSCCRCSSIGHIIGFRCAMPTCSESKCALPPARLIAAGSPQNG